MFTVANLTAKVNKKEIFLTISEKEITVDYNDDFVQLLNRLHPFNKVDYTLVLAWLDEAEVKYTVHEDARALVKLEHYKLGNITKTHSITSSTMVVEADGSIYLAGTGKGHFLKELMDVKNFDDLKKFTTRADILNTYSYRTPEVQEDVI